MADSKNSMNKGKPSQNQEIHSQNQELHSQNRPEIEAASQNINPSILNDITSNENLASIDNLDNIDSLGDDILNSSGDTDVITKSLECLTTREQETREEPMDQVSITSELSTNNETSQPEKANQPETEPKNEEYTTQPEKKHNKKTTQINTQDKTHNNNNTEEDTKTPNTNSRAKTNPAAHPPADTYNPQTARTTQHDETPILNTFTPDKTTRKNLQRSAKTNICYLQLSGKENKKKENSEKETKKKNRRTTSTTSSPRRTSTRKTDTDPLAQFLPDPEEVIKELRKTNDLKQTQIEELKEETTSLKRTIQELIAETDRTNALQEQHTNREREYREREEELLAENERLRQEIIRIKDSQHNTDEYEKMKKRLQREIETLTSIHAQQEEAINVLHSQKEQLIKANEKFQAYVKDLKERNKIQEDRLDTLSNKINQKRQKDEARGETPPPKRHRLTPSTSQEPVKERTTTQPSTSSIPPSKKTQPEQITRRTLETSKSTRSQTESSDEDSVTVTIERRDDRNQRQARIILVTERAYEKARSHLKSNTKDKTITYFPNCNSIEELEEKLTSEKQTREFIQADQIIILFGAGELRRGISGRELANRLLTLVRKISRDTITQVKLCEIPPIEADERTRKEREKFNEKIKELGQRCFTLNRVKSLKLQDAIEEDGRTITDLAADRIARDLDQQAMPASAASQTIKRTLDYDHSTIGRIIGRSGKNRQELEETCGVHLIAYKNTIVLKGHPSCVTKATEEIAYQDQQHRSDRSRYETYYQARDSRDSSPS